MLMPLLWLIGTPPHAWGRSSASISAGSVIGYTPTRVGKIKKSCCIHPPMRVHPHVRGEDIQLSLYDPDIVGTPPPAWGKVMFHAVPFIYYRYTPTRVGKSWKRRRSLPSSRVHPHACGEKTYETLILSHFQNLKMPFLTYFVQNGACIFHRFFQGNMYVIIMYLILRKSGK